MTLIKHLPAIAFALGMPIAHAQAPNGGIASPFGAPSIAATPATSAGASLNTAPAGAAVPSLSLAQVKAALAPAAAKKIRPQLLDAVLRGEQRDVIVMFQDQSGAAGTRQPAARMTMEKNAFSATRRNVQATLGAANVVFLREYEHLPFALVRVQSNAALIGLLNHPLVASVAENVAMRPQTKQSLPLIHQPQAIASGRGGAGTTVAVLDTGANIGTASLGYCNAPNAPASCRVVATYDATGKGFTTVSPSSDHGTTTAEIVAQVAPGAQLALVDIYVDGVSYVEHMLEGINWTILNKQKHNIVAMNFNAAFEHVGNGVCNPENPDYKAMVAVLAKLRKEMIFPVIAAGNNFKTNNRANFPACASTGGAAAVVAAVYDQDMAYTGGLHHCSDPLARANQMTCFSSRHPWVNIAAPGSYIQTGAIVEFDPSGTSYAAPHVAGAVAVLRAADAAPGDSLEQTLERLRNTGLETAPPAAGATQPPASRIPRLDMMASLNSVFHLTVTQQFYAALLGRPADPAGLRAFAQGLRDSGAPSTIVELNAMYDRSAQIRSLVDVAGASPEVAALYPGNNAAFVTAMYQNILDRTPDAGGLDYWKGLLDRGVATRGRLALAIAASAQQYEDGTTLNRKAAVAANFTNALDQPDEVASYQRSSAEARAMLRTVSAQTYVEDMDAVIQSTIASMLNR